MSDKATVCEWKLLLPPIVPSHQSDRLEMTEHACYHSRDACNTLQENKPCYPFLFCHGTSFRCRHRGWWIWLIARDKIHAPTQNFDCAERNPVLPVRCLAVGSLDGKDLLLSVSIMGWVVSIWCDILDESDNFDSHWMCPRWFMSNFCSRGLLTSFEY